MQLFYIKHKEKEYQFAITDVLVDDCFEVVFIKNKLPGEWVYVSESDIIKRVDIASTEEHGVFVKQICDSFSDETMFEKLDLILGSQVDVKNNRELWTKIKYDVVDTEDGGKMVNIITHKVAFYFGVNGELRGIRSWK